MAEISHKPDTSGTSRQDTGAHGVMVARARALIPQLRERAGKTEELRRLPPETERDLHETGLFRVLQPKRVGGSELDYVALVDCADALGDLTRDVVRCAHRRDAADGWLGVTQRRSHVAGGGRRRRFGQSVQR